MFNSPWWELDLLHRGKGLDNKVVRDLAHPPEPGRAPVSQQQGNGSNTKGLPHACSLLIGIGDKKRIMLSIFLGMNGLGDCGLWKVAKKRAWIR
jgi:hypothetical protein